MKHTVFLAFFCYSIPPQQQMYSFIYRSIYLQSVILPASPAIQQLSDGIAMFGILAAAHKKPALYEVLFTASKDKVFKWSFEDFLDEFQANYSDIGSIKHTAEVDCHKAFIDAMEEIFHSGKYFDYTLNLTVIP